MDWPRKKIAGWNHYSPTACLAASCNRLSKSIGTVLLAIVLSTVTDYAEVSLGKNRWLDPLEDCFGLRPGCVAGIRRRKTKIYGHAAQRQSWHQNSGASNH